MSVPDVYTLVPKQDVPIHRLEEQVYFATENVIEGSDLTDQHDITIKELSHMNINKTKSEDAVELHQYRGLPQRQIVDNIIDRWGSVDAVIVRKRRTDPDLIVEVFNIDPDGNWNLTTTDEIDDLSRDKPLRYRGVELNYPET